LLKGERTTARREFCHFLHHSRGSLAELETQLIISERLGYVSGAELQSLLLRVGEIGRILNGMISSLSEHKVA
jgi:four helix bundle protein